MKVQILGNNPQVAAIKTIDAEVQDFDNIIEIGNYKFYIERRVITDYIEPIIDMDGYLKIDNVIYKVLKINEYSDYQDIWLYKLVRQVAV